MMTRESMRTILEAYYHAFNAKDKDGILALFSEDADFIDLTMGRDMKGRNELSEFIDETWSLSPYFCLKPEEILIDGENAAVRLLMSGAAKTDNAGNPNPTDIWCIPSTTFYKLRDQKIYWKADCWNMLSIPKQIGWIKTLPKMLRANRKKTK